MKRWWPLLAALVYVVVTAGSLSALPKAPGVNASGEALVRYYRDHGGALRTATWLLTWSLVPFVILMAHVRSFLSGLCRDVMLISVTVFVTTGTVWTWFNAGLALHAATLDARSTRTLVDISLYFGPILTVADVLLAGAIGLGPTLDLAIQHNDPLRTILAASVAAALMLAGAYRRLQAPLVLGASALLLLAIDTFGPAAARLPRWVPLAIAGVLLMWVGARFERSRDAARRASRTFHGFG